MVMYVHSRKGNSFETSWFVGRPLQLTLHWQSRLERKGEHQTKQCLSTHKTVERVANKLSP